MGLFDNITDLIPGLGNPFGLPSEGLWNLQQGSFTVSPNGGGIGGILGSLGSLVGLQNTVVFYVESVIGQFPNQYTAIDTISDGGGRRLAAYDYPYIDGTAYKDLGRKGEKFTMNIKFFGSNYQILFKNFIEVVTKSSQKGTLNHPVRGSFPARFLDWEFVHRHDEWNAVTIRATFVEDNIDQSSQLNIFSSITSLLTNALQVLSSVTTAITTSLSAISAVIHLPAAILSNLKNSLAQLAAEVSSFLGKISATYSTDAQTQTLFANAVSVGGVLNVNSGTTASTPAHPSGQLPPVFQVGFSPADQTNILAQLSSFVDANQITPQQALFLANQVRSSISLAINEVTTELGNNGYSIVLQYRILAIQIQTVTQAAVSSIQNQVTQYQTPYAMSLRQVAFLNGLSVDRQNEIENLNPFLPSVNYIPKGSTLLVPVQ